MNVGEPSTKTYTLHNIREFTQEQSLMSVVSVAKPFDIVHLLLSIKKLTQKKSPTSVINVKRLLARPPI